MLKTLLVSGFGISCIISKPLDRQPEREIFRGVASLCVEKPMGAILTLGLLVFNTEGTLLKRPRTPKAKASDISRIG